MDCNRAAFLTGSVALVGGALARPADAATAPPTSATPEMLLGQLMAGNKRFVDGDFPAASREVTKRALVVEGQAPFASVLSCADSRVIPELVFVQGIGQLFVTRVAGNYPDDLVTGSIEYAVEHLGTTIVLVLGHERCGAVKAVYGALKEKKDLPEHLSAIQRLIAPGIAGVVAARGSLDAAIEANVRAAMAALHNSPPVIAKEASAGRIRVAGGVYHLKSGAVKLLQ
ncbi:MAG: carbonic anhydrase [Candidatus Eremiobacteraeota bacterium]|nr:carbonic anhydrase [Candidatus Eremiobacteraeota bacterium]MBV8499725.1 carbonic anhydrase [Candidatus Eremiobacteraeota bacterium]